MFSVRHRPVKVDGRSVRRNGHWRSKAKELADVTNRLLQTLVTRCDYFDIVVIGARNIAISPGRIRTATGPLATRPGRRQCLTTS